MSALITEAQAKKIEQTLDRFIGGDLDVKTLKEELKALKEKDLKDLIESLEKVKAHQATMKEQIRTSKHGFYIPGIEDKSKDFNFMRACLGVKLGGTKAIFEKLGAGSEFELLKAVQDKYGEEFGLRKDAQRTDDHALGGAMVPDQVIPDVIPAIYGRSAFINLDGEGETIISVVDGLFGKEARIPKFDGGMVAYWIAEGEQVAQSLVNSKTITGSPHKLMVLGKITKEMREMQGFGFDQMWRRDMIRKAALKLDWTIAYGTGAEMPRGIVNHPDVKIFSAQAKAVITRSGIAAANGGDWQGGELDFDQLDEMWGVLEDDDIMLDAAGSVSGPRYFRRLKRIKVENYAGQTANAPYLIGVPMVPDGRLRELIGPFGKTTNIATNKKPGASVGAPSATGAAKFTDVFTGNMREVLFLRWAGIEIDSDQGLGSGFAADTELVKLRMRGDVVIRQERDLIFCPDARARA